MSNWMIYVRGHPKDYDEWEQMGNQGWSYEDVLPYFKKSENFQVICVNYWKFESKYLNCIFFLRIRQCTNSTSNKDKTYYR